MKKVKSIKVKKYTDASDDRADKKAGIKENSPRDIKLDKLRGVSEDDLSIRVKKATSKYDGRKAPMKKLGMRMNAMKKAVR